MADALTDSAVSGLSDVWKEASERLLSKAGFHVVLDTNVLMDMFGRGRSAHNQARKSCIVEVCTKSCIYSTDTVYYEFLRICRFEDFRKKRAQLDNMVNITRGIIIPCDTAAIRRQFEKLFLLYMYARSGEPSKIAKVDIGDLWVAAAATTPLPTKPDVSIDAVLTYNTTNDDFCSTFFDSEEFDFSDEDGKRVLYLKTYKRDVADRMWREIEVSKLMLLNFDGYKF